MAKFCISCGTQMDDSQQFCPSCGAQQNGQAASTGASAPAAATGKSKLVAGLLAIFLGGWGIHNFYLGNTGRGVAQIIVTIVTCGIGAIWGLIEVILIFTGSINTDANGNPLVD